ncbi:MAG: 1,2-phenylacetyl-CoA epoxidase subunit PaaD [Sphingomonadaceae bacterium]|nr:1,2-phenylacetyl-CoA epoxidase subunit PaaD [Sphingomonadaceae bacterium]
MVSGPVSSRWQPARPVAPPRAAEGGDSDETELIRRTWVVLASVPDPEIPAVSVVDLGMVRSVTKDSVTLTPTYSGCPATLAIELAVAAALRDAGLPQRVATTLSPAWSTDWISDAGRERLRAYGIAPPPRGAAEASLHNRGAAECPRCGSSHTREVSRFGSTPCKAQWRCLDCLEPFDRMKCH